MSVIVVRAKVFTEILFLADKTLDSVSNPSKAELQQLALGKEHLEVQRWETDIGEKHALRR